MRYNQIHFCSFQKGRWLPLEQLQKVIKHPLEQIPCGIHEKIAYNTDNVSNISLEELNLKLKNLEASFKILLTIRRFLLMKVYPLSG